MTVKQISVFLENKNGTLVKILRILKENGIQIIASTIADTAEYGIFRIICENPDKAYAMFKAAGIQSSLCDVLAITLEDVPGMASDAVESLTAGGINIAYLYSFLFEGKGVLIFKADDNKKAIEIIKSKNYKTLNSF